MSFRFFLVAVLSLAFAWNSQAQNAQKLGHVYFDTIISMMPESMRAKSELEAYQIQLKKRLEAEEEKLKVFNENTSKQAANLPPAQLKQKEAELVEMQQNLQKMAMEAEQDLAAKEQELTKEVYRLFDEALVAVAKAEEFSYVFDKKMLMFSENGVDLTSKVIAKLGLSGK